jgi:hypothetical protein
VIGESNGDANGACRRVHKFREELCDDTLAYDLEFDD